MRSLGASPVVVGAVTVMVAIVAVFLAYQANTGLPFVPTYKVSAEVPNAESLVPGNEIRIGGIRVGMVDDITPEQADDGSVRAKLDLTLDSDIGPLPADSTIVVRARSALGLKYLELRRGSSGETLAEGSTLSLTQAQPETIDIDEVLNTFDEPTRDASQVNLAEFGNALAGRGGNLNAALGELPATLRHLEPAMRALGSREANLRRFVVSLRAFVGELAPVAEQNANLFVSLDRTFAAIAEVSRPHVQEMISESPPTLDQANVTLPRIRPFIRHSAELFAALRPGMAAIAPRAPQLASGVEIGVPALRRGPAFNRQLPPTSALLVRLTNDADFRSGVDKLTEGMAALRGPIGFITPAQTVCNYGGLLLRNVADSFSNGNGLGNWQRFITIFPVIAGPNSQATPSSAPASGPSAENFLHYNPYPNTAAPGQTRECEAGKEPWNPTQVVIGNPPGNQGTTTENTR